MLKIEDCIDTAYNVIARRRTGKMINGTFVKREHYEQKTNRI
jgi:hypothetical protein